MCRFFDVKRAKGVSRQVAKLKARKGSIATSRHHEILHLKVESIDVTIINAPVHTLTHQHLTTASSSTFHASTPTAQDVGGWFVQ